MKSAAAYSIFEQSVKDYHMLDRIDQPYNNPYPANSVEHLMYRKNWIDTIQWHYEDLIRPSSILKSSDLFLLNHSIIFLTSLITSGPMPSPGSNSSFLFLTLIIFN